MLRWSDILEDRKLRLILGLSVFGLLTLASISPYFFDIIQSRNGFFLHDPLLEFLPSADVSNLIFSILYFMVIVSMIYLLRDPLQLLFGLQAYVLMMTIRFATIFFISLEPPRGLIVLRDPFAALFLYGQSIVTKDLFFSGHAATLFLLFMVLKNKILKTCLFVGSITICVLLLIQHIHYTYDVLAAPLFAFGAYKISYAVLKKHVYSDVL